MSADHRALSLVPLLTVGTVAASWAHRPRPTVGPAAVAGSYVGVLRAPDTGLVRTEWGVILALIGAVALVACWTAIEIRRARSRVPRTPV